MFDTEECVECGTEVDWLKYDYCPMCEAYDMPYDEPLDEIEAERNANI